jgi:hypothetical protein
MKGSSPKGLELSTLSVFFNISLSIAFLMLFVILTVWDLQAADWRKEPGAYKGE